ncbi:MAG: cation-translocating P-type ATPase [Armatimonadetes bacterium]|nr:cation-translocating P-type ATPase [Armatimonadota bacterium]
MLRGLQTALTILCGLALLGSFFGLAPWLALAAVIAGSPFALGAALEALRERRLDVNILMVLAGAGAVALGHTQEAAVLLFLFSLSSTLEELTMAKTRSAIEGLIKLRPDSATVIGEQGDRSVPLADVKMGESVRVKPFEAVPLDGVIISGSSSIDQSAMTGESVPVQVAAGSSVIGGTQNLDGMLVVEVKRVVGDTTLEKIVDLVRDAQENKASGERISQWFGQRYTIFVLLAAVLSVVIRFALKEDVDRALYASLTLLVALSPCALVISTPATTLSALAWAARHGVLVRGGQFIEQVGVSDAIAMDKTGTLTVGKPVLEEICVCGEAPVAVGSTSHCREEHACWSRGGGTMSEGATALLRLAAAAEQYSTHPLAEAIVVGAREHGIDVPEATEQRTVSGMGVVAVVDGQEVQVGQPKFFQGLPEEFLAHAREIQANGMTVALLKSGRQLAALGLRDAPRPEARGVLGRLRDLGFERMVLLTGDNEETARTVASELGIEDVRAGLMPDDKEKIVAELAGSSKGVVFVGDGTNDAPSLARANVGVAMGGLGSDVALNAADVVLMQDNLNRLPEIVSLGRKTNRTIRANLLFATGVITCLTIGSILVDAFLPHLRDAVLPYAVVGHEGSTVLVILNGLRLLSGVKSQT